MNNNQILRKNLIESKMPWWQENVELDLWQIYEVVSEIYPSLCDSSIKRQDNGEKEWHHITRLALDDLKKEGVVRKVNPFKPDGRWVKI